MGEPFPYKLLQNSQNQCGRVGRDADIAQQGVCPLVCDYTSTVREICNVCLESYNRDFFHALYYKKIKCQTD